MLNRFKMFMTDMWDKASEERGHPHHSLLYSSPTISPSTTVTNFSSIQSIQSIQSTKSVQSRIHQQYFSKMGTKEQNMIIGSGEIAPLNNTVCGSADKKFVAASINSEYSPYTPTTTALAEPTEPPASPTVPEEDSNSNTSSQPKSTNFAKQVLAALSVSIGSLTVGFVSAYTSTALVSIRNDENAFSVSSDQESWIGSLMPLSALIGGIVGGPLIEYLGRKKTILMSAFPFIVSWLLIAFAVNVPMLYLARVISGFSVGIASLAFPVYLGETLQPEVRGMLGLLPTALGNIGILLCFVAGSILKWSHLALLGACLPIPFLALMMVIPETPRWFFTKGRKYDAEHALIWLRGKNVDVSEELAEIEKSQIEANKNQNSNGISELFQHQYLKPLMIALGLMFFQQLSGINAVIFYTVEIFQSAGSSIDSNLCTIIVGVVNFVSVFVATMLIDRLGRKILLYISSIAMTITLVTLCVFFYLKEIKYDVSDYGWIPLASFVVYIIAFSLGFGPIPWLMLGEILPANVRGPAASIATAFNWTCAFVVTKAFKDLSLAIGVYGTFGIFAKVCFVAFFFTVFFVPETQGRTLEDIEKALTGAKVRRMSSVINIKPMPTAC